MADETRQGAGQNPGGQEGRRAELMERLLAAGRAQSAAAIMFHTALAAKQGISASEEKALDLLDRYGPLTAGELSERSGLAPASVTGLIDRLERKGYATRVRHPEDGRRVLIETNPERLAQLAPLFVDFVQSLRELCAGYTDEQLETIIHFMTESTARQRDAAARLSS